MNEKCVPQYIDYMICYSLYYGLDIELDIITITLPHACLDHLRNPC